MANPKPENLGIEISRASRSTSRKAWYRSAETGDDTTGWPPACSCSSPLPSFIGPAPLPLRSLFRYPGSLQIYPSQTFTVLNASGYVVAQRKSALATKVTGRLVWLGVEEGSRVKAGDVIARLESQDVMAARDQARANLNMARWNVDQARAELDGRNAWPLQRAKDLVAKGYIAQADYDTALARFRRRKRRSGRVRQRSRQARRP